jgi:hypothetical protein
MRGVIIALIVIGAISVASRDPDEGPNGSNPAEPVLVQPEFTG